MDAQKKFVVEVLQALMLENEVRGDYLSAALEAAKKGDFNEVSFFMEALMDTESVNIAALMAQVRGEPNGMN
jgi:hypothetical protein